MEFSNYEAEEIVDAVNNTEGIYLAKERWLAELSDDGVVSIGIGQAKAKASEMGLVDIADVGDFERSKIDWSQVAEFWTLEMREYTETTELEFKPVKGVSLPVW